MDKIEKAFELIAKYTSSNRDLINFGIIIGLLAIAFMSSSTQINVAGVNKTTVLTFVNASSKINISQINSLETWNATRINDTFEGTVINWTNRYLTTNTYSFIDAGSNGNSFALGISDKPLMYNNTSGVKTDDFSNQTILTFTAGGVNQFVSYDGNYTCGGQFNRGYGFGFGTGCSKFIQIEDGIDAITAIPGQSDPGGGLNMGNNPIYNSPTISYMWSTGVVQGGDLTYNNATHTISISAGLAMIRTGLNSTDKLVNVKFEAKNFSIAYWETKFIYLNFSTLNSTLEETTTLTDVLGSQQIQVYQTFLNDQFHYIDARAQNIDSGTKLRTMLYETDRFKHASGSMIGSPSGLNLSLTAGRYFYGLNPIEHNTMNTATGSNIEYYYHNSTGVWASYNSTIINNTAYNPVGSGIVTMTNTRYKTEWVYLTLSSDNTSEIDVILGQNQYVTIAGAEAELAPTNLPIELRDISVLIGRVILQKNDLTLVSVESAFNIQYTPSAISNHNSLSSLQGGQLNEYYHLNATQYTNIISSILPIIQPSSPALGSIFYNSTSHTTNCYDGGWRYCGNGTFV